MRTTRHPLCENDLHTFMWRRVSSVNGNCNKRDLLNFLPFEIYLQGWQYKHKNVSIYLKHMTSPFIREEHNYTMSHVLKNLKEYKISVLTRYVQQIWNLGFYEESTTVRRRERAGSSSGCYERSIGVMSQETQHKNIVTAFRLLSGLSRIRGRIWIIAKNNKYPNC
jgi:hypothetical protein